MALAPFLLLLSAALPATAALTCENFGNRDQATHCEIQEQHLGSFRKITVDAKTNGGISVKSWDSPGTLVRAKVEAYAATEPEARAIYAQVIVHSSGGVVAADGPASGHWSVSYELMVPAHTDLNLTAHNGGISISGINGNLEFSTKNGGVHLAQVAGDVHGRTENGGVHVELAGARWEGRGLDVESHNGGVNVIYPEHYSAHLETSTVNGSVRTDLLPASTQHAPRDFHIDLGSGGATIHVTTVNGGVHVSHLQPNAL